MLEIQWWKELMREECQANRLLKSENSQEQPSVTCTTPNTFIREKTRPCNTSANIIYSRKNPHDQLILSKPIMRVDTKQRKKVVTDVNNKLGELNIDIIDNGNLDRNHLNCKGLHLNGEGILLYAKNLIDGIRKL